ncbi:hypothetical protein RSOLAG22IIIB_10250 [Rhizoctonia solani]|uniref:Uncharacterized protein n=1 Tax=Rhizoctonia solani TaxID=456999 RepID=A0A0K6G2H7_9AGAM|nr:hypothetical protein RSOLAG22IIIB_10250 [Rhizoctonia solani]
MLAIGCDGEVWIYARSVHTGAESWDCVDHILAPCTGSASLVMALCFFGTAMSRRYLFIGHAKAGWTVWTSPRTYNRTPFMDGGEICTIGSATVPPSERFIAISTLGNSLITYSLREGGPDINTQSKADFRELTKYCPALPIVSTSSDLVLKGTAVGAIEVLDPKSNSTASLHHAHNHMIRTLNATRIQAYGDKVVVGSSDMSDNSASSCLRCYTFSSAAEPRDWRRIDEIQGPIFEVTLSSILPFSERMVLYNPFGIFDIIQAIRMNLRWKQGTVFIFVCSGVLFFALALDPPSRAPLASATDLQLSNGRYPSQSPPRKPALSTLIFCQTAGWIAKLGGVGGLFLAKNLFFALNLLMRVVLLVPRVLKEAMAEVPDVLAGFICEMLRLHGFDDICPE